jgi:Tudor domain
VLFVDFGNELVIKNKRLLEIAGRSVQQIPFLGLRCQLAKIGPLDSSWSSEAIDFFSQQVLGNFCVGEVYSVVESIVHVNLVCDSKIINCELVASGFATSTAETYLSRVKLLF